MRVEASGEGRSATIVAGALKVRLLVRDPKPMSILRPFPAAAADSTFDEIR